MPRTVWDDVVGQPRIVTHLQKAVEASAISHAYLFAGLPGSGKEAAAKALACSALCSDSCGACPVCARVLRGTHPDVHVIDPEGASAYLASQVRGIIRDVNLAPIEGEHKVYILKAADRLNDAAANALLKTLEEPPGNVIFILLTHSANYVLPTIISRCQVLRFRRIPPREAAAILAAKTGAGAAEAGAALAAAGGVFSRASAYLMSDTSREARLRILHTLGGLNSADDLDVLNLAAAVLKSVKAPLEEVAEGQAAEVAEHVEVFGKTGVKALEDSHKRALTAREWEGIAEAFNVTEGWLRDCLVLAQGAPELVVNVDVADAMADVAAVLTPASFIRAIEAVNEARRRISYNVSSQLVIEAMLFKIRKALECPR
ncbi:MAG: DNA polymerase III subunit delta' [Coriobacteriia bacterium]|nr:DNA polymerase III subunit delta' [Coriobacteriia bacterium]